MNYANQYGYSDVEPYEIIRRVTDKTIEIRAMDAKLLNGCNSGEPDALKFSPGGFCGHTSGTQRYEYSQRPDAPVVRIRLHKDGKWKDASGHKYRLADAPYKFYDFNF